MAIEFICPSCQGTLSMPDETAGQLVRCGGCMATLRVPELPAAPPEVVTRPKPRSVVPVRPQDDDRDEHGEPTPRRRRKGKKGRSPLFWILIVMLALGLVTCLACGGIWFAVATPKWHNHESPRGNFTVMLPAPLHPEISQQAGMKQHLKPNDVVEGTILAGRLELYWVWHSPIGDRPPGGDDLILDELQKHVTDDVANELVKSTPRTVSGRPARELVIRHNEDEWLHCLVVVGKTRLYIVAAGGPFMEREPNERVRKFFDSFQLK